MLNTHDEIIGAARSYVRAQMPEDYTGHDYLHVERVWKLAKQIAAECGANATIVELAALFHDISDYKLNGGSETDGPEKARCWIEGATRSPSIADKVAQIILDIPFRGALSPAGPPLSIEAQCVQDADRLDAIGAIGIARAFAFGGAMKQKMLSADIKPALHSSFAQYKRKNGTTVNHFYEKLLLLTARMNTPAGRRIAETRHALMLEFLRQLSDETGMEFGIPDEN
ncbi:phosphohydrolase [Trinickia dabaoshanensis]|uniref:Phosphohydrolase n=1 Tax=Trinickia dabaoshanensis TaxID=564714 RepID=A0A2N7VZ97_9BURK|nr:HD domain-containing protein [Trinickia dabaoshanensis]PMS22465.1 phosphohydrolase [Trinickia dabaoshanensis]